VKGVLFNVAEDVVNETLGAAAWDGALRHACVDGIYTSIGDYPHGELDAIVDAIAGSTGLAPADVLRHVGRHGYEPLVQRQPALVAGIDDLGALLHRLEEVIHPEVHKLYPDATPPEFSVADLGPGSWELVYRSDRGLCHLAEGLVQGAAASFATTVEVVQTDCALEGADRCVLQVRTETASDA